MLESSVYNALKEAIIPLLRLASCHITGIHTPDESKDPSIVENFCISLLDAGAVSVNFQVGPGDSLITLRVLKSFMSQFPRTRTGICSDTSIVAVEDMNLILEELIDSVSYFFLATEINDKAVLFYERSKAIVSNNLEVHIIFKSSTSSTATMLPSREDIVKLSTMHENVHTSIVSKLTSADGVISLSNPMTPTQLKDQEGHSIDLLGCFVGCLKTDRPDGLYTTVVCDESHVCLGLVYSNETSIRAAICEGKGIYWSRSRGGLWRKGDTSGMHQELLGVQYDCDRDALRFSVIQHGTPKAFCHLLTRTCWGHERGLQKLESTLRERKLSAPEGSYTKKLFDNPDMLRKKMLEEVQELVEAEEPDHIAAEAADVLYFVMTRCVAGGVGIKDIEKHLDQM